ncbi:MAG: YqiJ family protein [Shewanella sp.]|nr:YqiJ family protein [Shewanella sp.]
MMDFVLAHQNWPFTLAFILVIGLGLFELISMLVGLSLLSALDDLLPIDINADTSTGVDGVTGILGWLCLGRLPLLIWLVLVLTSFAITGLTINYLSLCFMFHYFPEPYALVAATVLTLFSCRYLGAALARKLPKNESSAINHDELAGSVGTITVGRATQTNPAEAVIKDAFTQKHYVRVVPNTAEEHFEQGTKIVLLRRENNIWFAARLHQ